MGWLKDAAAVAAAADGDLIVSSRRLAERFSEELRKHSKAKSLSKVLYTPRRSSAMPAYAVVPSQVKPLGEYEKER